MKKKKLHPISQAEYEHLMQFGMTQKMEPIETELEGFLVYCPYCGPVYLPKDMIVSQKAVDTVLYISPPLSAMYEKGALSPTTTAKTFKGLKEVITFRCECHLLLSIECLVSGSGSGVYHSDPQGGIGWKD